MKQFIVLARIHMDAEAVIAAENEKEALRHATCMVIKDFTIDADMTDIEIMEVAPME